MWVDSSLAAEVADQIWAQMVRVVRVAGEMAEIAVPKLLVRRILVLAAVVKAEERVLLWVMAVRGLL